MIGHETPAQDRHVPEDAPEPYALAGQAAVAIAQRTGVERHDVAVVLGSGWQDAVAELGETRAEVATDELPGFAAPTVAGHHGRLRSMEVAGVATLVISGRVHLYEGHTPAQVVHPVRSAVLSGARTVVLTNAAGGLDPAMRPGQAVLIRDHLNLTGRSPLGGPPPPPGFAPRFVDLTECYSARLRGLARAADPTLAEGVYAAFPGPHYETPAEIEMVRRIGGSLVGMSTALEAIAARHLGAEVLAISLVTNLAAGVSAEPLDHEEVLAAGAAAAPGLARLVRAVIGTL
ncbi:MAG TPA: purine-nucleoside phosphorylase [Acidimicrobiales bacterium]|nr:purine-nucleoside phosphorylase [Acidimicrobiales bacterium]